MEELEILLKQMRSQPIEIIKEPKIYYIVSIKERYIPELHLTTITKEICVEMAIKSWFYVVRKEN